jgi:zinc protease
MPYSGYEFVEESGGIRCFRMLNNGLQVLVQTVDLAPVVACMVTYRVGSINEKGGETGATHFLEHLMFKGTERFNKDNGTSVFSTLQRLGARVNATTWLDRTNYYELLPDDQLDVALEIESDRMRGARLLEGDVESERTVILNEFDRGQNVPSRRLYHAVWSAAFTAHPYRQPTIGWRSDIENLSAEQLRRFYDHYYWPDNATVSVVGSVSEESVLSSVGKYFSRIPGADHSFRRPTTVEPEQIGERRTEVRLPGALGSLLIAFKSPDAVHPDTAVLTVISAILTTGKMSRLYRSLVDPGLATGVSASSSMLKNPGLFSLFIMLGQDAVASDVEGIVYDELKRLKSHRPESSELNRVKSRLISETVFARDGAFAVVANLNEAIAAGDWKLYTTFVERIDDVDAESIQRAANTYFREESRTVGEYRPEEG